MKNVLGLVREDIQRHKISVVLPDETEARSLYLVEVTGLTSKLKDFKEAYGKLVTAIHEKIAEKVFGESETQNVYGVLFDEDLKMVFAFNRSFADYDQVIKEIVYRDIDEILLEKVEVKKEKPTPSSGGQKRFDSGGGMVLRYSLAEKEVE